MDARDHEDAAGPLGAALIVFACLFALIALAAICAGLR